MLQCKQKKGTTFVGLNAGFNALLRPALYQAYHELANLTRDGPPRDVTICGPICESGDVFGRSGGLSLHGRLGAGSNARVDRARPLPASTQVGDVVVIDCCGAYGRSMASTYNLRQVPEERVLD